MNSANRGDNSDIVAQAVHWHLASSGEDMDWEGFTVWLEADTRHRLVYDEVALTHLLISEHRHALRQHVLPEQPAVASPPARRMTRWLPVGLGAAAAAVLAIVAGPALIHPADRTYATGASSRVIALADGSLVTLAPRSRLVISGSDGNAMRLTGGGWFDVRHVAARELAISAGPVTIRDIGTHFDIQVDGNLVRVAVAQGKVEVASPALAQPIALTGGRALLFDGQQGVASVSTANSAEIGDWRKDRLSYENAPLALVADDLGRYAGIHLDVPAELLSRRFSGTLIIGNGIEAPRDLAQLMGLALVRGHDGLRLAPRGNPAAAN